MTQLLEEAIATLRELSDDEQDAAALALFAYISGDDRDQLLSAGDGQRAPSASRPQA